MASKGPHKYAIAKIVCLNPLRNTMMERRKTRIDKIVSRHKTRTAALANLPTGFRGSDYEIIRL